MTAESATISRREMGLAVTGFLLLALLFMARGLPADRAPVTTDPLYANADDVPFREVRPRDFVPGNPFLSDQALVFYPWLRFMSEAVRSGQLPLWSPHSAGGQPFIGNLSAAFFYPLTWLCFLPPSWLTVARGMVWGAVVRLFLAGFFGWLLLRRIGLVPVAAVAGGVIFALFGYQVVWLFYSLSNVACLMPLCLYLAFTFAERPGPTRGLAFAVGMALQFLGGHAETSVALAIAVAALYAQTSRQRGSPWSTALLRFVAVGGVALALCSFQVLPFVEYLLRSQGRVERMGLAMPEVARVAPFGAAGLFAGTVATGLFVVAIGMLRRSCGTGGSLVAGALAGLLSGVGILLWLSLGLSAQLLLLIDPDLRGNPLLAGGYRGFEAYTDVNGGFCGVLALLLGLCAALCGTRRWLVAAATWPLCLALVLFGGVEPFHGLLKQIPPFDLAADSRMLPLVGVGVALLAALALDDLRRGHAAVYARTALRLLTAATVAAALVLAFVEHPHRGDRGADRHTGVIRIESPRDGATFDPQPDSRGRGSIDVVVSARLPEDATRAELIVGGTTVAQATIGPPGHLTARWSASRVPEGRYTLAIQAWRGAEAIALSPIAGEGRPHSIEIRRRSHFTLAGALRAGLALLALIVVLRAGVGHSLRLWLAPAIILLELWWFGFDYNGFVPQATVYPQTSVTRFLAGEAERWRAAGQGPFRVLPEDVILQPNMNYAYDLSMIRGYDQLELAAFRRFLAQLVGDVSLGQLNRASIDLTSPLLALLNVAYVVTAGRLEDLPGYRLAMDGEHGRVYRNEQALPRAFVVGQAIDMRGRERAELLALGPTRTAYLEQPPPAPLGGSGSVAVLDYQLNHVRLRASVDAPAMLILTDNDYPGWQASVAGREVPIQRTHGTFRAVAIPAGTSEVTFDYRPRTFWGGLWAAAGCLVLALWHVAAARRRCAP